ncbi:2-amino-4-hydroxy-6-hydroxymethyldihydropteridine diphosphokinase [Agromyces kandeliae]|uniref:2-amino-4-hydroxy-6-hydroxymethyldihydropteridine diphosphokinase n=1 Tax=Agromyces kandeliae TaxID=2666141 RepID=A0A6L5R4U4_9MICO|nr:2-amino-4-hydroxy-6-hydroxymethyldihydropteridine diphosphokinase [Agromyces kandeliae]MRX44378.1 2-amino-4-hydroxy-6-hydroxymethyldihydropteridine diphosphokinase [Agromyces kandeliae]
MTRAVIAYGANLGDREATLASAMRAIAEADGVELVAVSPVYESAAVRLDGVDPDAPRYLNGVIVVETRLGPHALLDLLQRVEAEHGRTRETRWGDRTLDLDLIDVRGVRLADERLELPHPRAWERAFVLQPWLDVEPDAEIAGRGAVAALRAEATDEVVRR